MKINVFLIVNGVEYNKHSNRCSIMTIIILMLGFLQQMGKGFLQQMGKIK